MARDGSLVRCVKHPSHVSLGFCSFCLVERLSTVGLTKGNLDPINNSPCEIMEITIGTPKLDENKEKPKTTLLALFELDDLRNVKAKVEVESKGMKLLKWRKNGAPVDEKEPHDKCSMKSPRENQLRRSSSLRCACEWIACCNCDGGTIFPLGLKRSLSESYKDIKLFRDQVAKNTASANTRSQRVDSHKGNNGFIRFYLPPLKNSKKRANDNSRKRKRLFGIFGFYESG